MDVSKDLLSAEDDPIIKTDPGLSPGPMSDQLLTGSIRGST